MLGWEFPPAISGGLGIACHGLAQALGGQGVEIAFVLPKALGSPMASVEAGEAPEAPAAPERNLPHVTLRGVPVDLKPYQAYVHVHDEGGQVASPDQNEYSTGVNALLDQVRLYTSRVLQLADWEEYDVIHAHDWMTFPAAVALACRSGKPLIVHVHSTELDRAGADACQPIFEIERDGVRVATRVIAVSERTRSMLIERFNVPAEKIVVVYNAVPQPNQSTPSRPPRTRRKGPTVLFVGRLTMQKGPEYFLAAARRVADEVPGVSFIMAGDGDRREALQQHADRLGLANRVEFPGFLQGADLDNAFDSADVFVMPSVSEPFGIVPLEALSHGLPTIISRQSGVAEVLQDVLLVDFWDADDLADKILAVLRHEPLRGMLSRRGRRNIDHTSWDSSARQCRRLYDLVIAS
jgi:glycosyltransferase involved in cell wall biosynthesis